MSIPVDLASLEAEITRFGTSALLVTSSVDGPPHVSSVIVSVEEGELVMRVGRKTRMNAADHPAVTLVWTAAHELEHCLIVDGTARDGPSEHFVVQPTAAVLHRLAIAGT